jgi:hypothetical protein
MPKKTGKRGRPKKSESEKSAVLSKKTGKRGRPKKTEIPVKVVNPVEVTAPAKRGRKPSTTPKKAIPVAKIKKRTSTDLSTQIAEMIDARMAVEANRSEKKMDKIRALVQKLSDLLS